MDIQSLQVFGQAVVIGISIAAPVGPIGLLTIQRTLDRGPKSGFATGLGAALADMVYGAVGAFGVSSVISMLAGARLPLALAGAAILLWLAWRTWHAKLEEADDKAPRTAEASAEKQFAILARDLVGTFLLTVSNPATILSFVAIFSVLAGSSRTAVAPWYMVAGVFTGSCAWWLVLSIGVSGLRRHFTALWRRRVNHVSAAVLAIFALWQLISLV